MKKTITLIVFLLGLQFIANAQLYIPPGIHWQKSYWPYEDECYNFDDEYYNSASETDEDWFYKSCKSYNSSTFDGFVCAGYSSSYRIREEGSCYESDVYVGWRAKIAKIDPLGKVVWYKDYGEIFSELYSIIQGSDGYYYAIGRSHDFGNSIIYNPGTNQQYISGTFNKDIPRNSTRHLYIIKVAPNGDLVWQYIYRPYDQTNYPQNVRGMGFDIVESRPGYFKAVGFSQDYNGTTVGSDHPFIIEID